MLILLGELLHQLEASCEVVHINKYSEAGFTLIEMIMVMVLVSILSVSASALLPGSIMDVHAATNQLKQDIRWTQSVCLSNSGLPLPGSIKSVLPPCIIRSIGANQYEFIDSTNTRIARNTYASDNPATLNDVNISSFSISFDSRGNPGKNDQTVTVSNGSDSRLISIFGLSGLVR
jgi:prepilin-type N-terminal cleavage/methylation domain-containing protein